MSLTPLPGYYARVDRANGTGSALSNEAMNHVSDIENGNVAYTVYEITAAAKRYLKLGVVPTFEKQVGGEGSWVALTDIKEIQYPGGRVVLNTAIGATDLVRCATGTYLDVTQMYGCSLTKISDKNIMKDITCIGDSAKMQYPTIQEFSMNADVFYAGICAALEATMESGSNNSILLEHQVGGVAGNDISFEIAPAVGESTLSIDISGNAIVVTPASTAVPAITSTAIDVINALNLDPEFIALHLVAKQKSTETGLGIVTNYEHAHLTGGLDPADYYTIKAAKLPLILTVYAKYSSDIRWEGYVFIEDISGDLNPEDVVKQSLSLSGHGKLYFRPR